MGGMGFRRPIEAKTFGQLEDQSKPWAADTPGADPWVLYDTRVYVDNTTRRLTFFQTAQNDPSLSNIEVGGVLPSPTFMEIHFITLDVLPADGTFVSTDATTGVPGILDDIGRLIQSSLASWTLTIAGKDYGPFPLRACGSLGSLGTGAWGASGATAELTASVQWAINGSPGATFFVGGAWTIPPQQSYSIVAEWPAAVNTAVGNYNLAFGLVGTLYRKVS